MAGNSRVQLEDARGRPHQHQKKKQASFRKEHRRQEDSGSAAAGGGGEGGGGGGNHHHHHSYGLGKVAPTTTTKRDRTRRVLRRGLAVASIGLGLAGISWVVGTLLWGRHRGRYRVRPTDSPGFWGFQSRGPVTAESNRCADLDMSVFAKAMTCGSPLSYPCFEHHRCTPQEEGGSGTGMYVYDEECSLADSEFLSVDGKTRDGEKLGPHDVAWFWRRALKEAGLLAETYESACMFIHVSWVGVKPCAAEAPLWNGGANHVMVDFSDKGR